MRILISPCAYKGTYTPEEVALAIDGAIDKERFQTDIVPLADGGDGTVEAIHRACGGSLEKVAAHGPLGEAHEAVWLNLGDTAVVELASACGIALIKGPLSALQANTLGLGEVLRECLARPQFERVVVALGGSASTDGGSGALVAFGARLFDENGDELKPSGHSLLRLARLMLPDLSSCKGGQRLQIAVDVSNPLLGKSGAAAIFAPQKGASNEEVLMLEKGLARWAQLLEEAAGRKCREIPGSGAAGGTAFGLALAFGAPIVSGFALIADLLKLDERVARADLVITAEGSLDQQSLGGKAVGELSLLCSRHRKPLIAVPGTASGDLSAAAFACVVPSAKKGEIATLSDIGRAAKQALATAL